MGRAGQRKKSGVGTIDDKKRDHGLLKAQIAIPDAIELLRREDVISAYIYGTKGTLVTGISNVDRASVAARCSLEHLRTRKSAP
jgi:hypothetical protein